MPRKSRKNVGLIGLGIIGARVAATLRSAGCHVFVWSRTPKAVPNFLGSPAEIAEICEVIQIFVSDAQAVIDTIESFGDALSSNHVIINCSTIGPEATKEAAKLVQEKGAAFLDAPFTGSKIAAEKGQLCYYIGGDEAVFQRVKPILEATSRAIVKCGKVGDAATLKVATNLITAVTTQTLAEALAIVQKSGIAPEVFAAAIEQNACKSGVIELKLPKMVRGDFEPHFSLKHMFKDVQLGIHMANSFDLEVPVTTVTAGVMYGALNNGWADRDFSSVFEIYANAQPEEKFSAIGGPQQIEDRKQTTEPLVVEAQILGDDRSDAPIVEPPLFKRAEGTEAVKVAEGPKENAAAKTEAIPEVVMGDIFTRRAPQTSANEAKGDEVLATPTPMPKPDVVIEAKPENEPDIPQVIFGRVLPTTPKAEEPAPIETTFVEFKQDPGAAPADLEKTVIPPADKADRKESESKGGIEEVSVKENPASEDKLKEGANGKATASAEKPKAEEEPARFRPLQRIRRFFSPAAK